MPSSTTSSSESYFDTLPVELHGIILGLLPDLSSLRSTVLASHTAHAAYALSSQAIQQKIMTRMLSNSPQLTTESRWLHAASYIRRNACGWHDHLDDFLAFSEPDIEKYSSPLSYANVTAEGLRFHGVVEAFTNILLKAAMQSPRNREAAQSEGDFPAFSLQHAERIRIQRALYRFQRICQMYPRNSHASECKRPSWGDHPLREFIRGLPSWELEELRCVYRFLVMNLSFLDKAAGHDCHGSRTHVAGFTSYRSREQVASMGLMFMHKLMTSTVTSQLTLLREYCGKASRPVILSDILPLDGGQCRFGHKPRSRPSRTDSLLGPSAGWVVFRPSSRRSNSKEFEGAPLLALRDWGYCFWEKDRLEAWGYHVMRSETHSLREVVRSSGKRPSQDSIDSDISPKRPKIKSEDEGHFS